MNCYVCSEDKWHSLKELNQERELAVCKSCGCAAYQVDVSKEPEVKEYYRKTYRPEPTYENILTTNRKLNYVRIFLKEFLQDKKDLIVGDVGCATGYIPNWFRQIGHRATGCELTLTYRRFAENYYGIPIPEELEPKHKYDLIVMYHVLEHLMEPDKKLDHYFSLLKDDGHILVSTPEWLDTLEEASGSAMSSFQHLFHKDHINVFTKQSIANLFHKSGLEIVKEDHITYGQTYLLKKSDKKTVVSEKCEDVVKKIEFQDKAIKLYSEKKWQEALDLWPKFPEAYLNIIFAKHQKDPQAQEEWFDKAIKACPNNMRVLMAYGQWLYQNQKYEKSAGAFEFIAQRKPNEDVFMFLGWCYGFLNRPDLALRAFNSSWQINPMRWMEAQNAMCQTAARMPCWEEKAIQAMLEEAKKTLPKPEMNDPVLGVVNAKET